MDWLQARPDMKDQIDPGRIGLVGFSAGGLATYWLGQTIPV